MICLLCISLTSYFSYFVSFVVYQFFYSILFSRKYYRSHHLCLDKEIFFEVLYKFCHSYTKSLRIKMQKFSYFLTIMKIINVVSWGALRLQLGNYPIHFLIRNSIKISNGRPIEMINAVHRAC